MIDWNRTLRIVQLKKLFPPSFRHNEFFLNFEFTKTKRRFSTKNNFIQKINDALNWQKLLNFIVSRGIHYFWSRKRSHEQLIIYRLKSKKHILIPHVVYTLRYTTLAGCVGLESTKVLPTRAIAFLLKRKTEEEHQKTWKQIQSCRQEKEFLTVAKYLLSLSRSDLRVMPQLTAEVFFVCVIVRRCESLE